jgi:hypothetical protein
MSIPLLATLAYRGVAMRQFRHVVFVSFGFLGNSAPGF